MDTEKILADEQQDEQLYNTKTEDQELFYETSRFNQDTQRWVKFGERIPIDIVNGFCTPKDYYLQFNQAGKYRIQLITSQNQKQGDAKIFTILENEIKPIMQKEETKTANTIDDDILQTLKKKNEYLRQKMALQQQNDLIKDISPSRDDHQDQATFFGLLSKQIESSNTLFQQMMSQMITSQKEQQDKIIRSIEENNRPKSESEILSKIMELAFLPKKDVLENPLVQQLLADKIATKESTIDKVLPSIIEGTMAIQNRAMMSAIEAIGKQTTASPGELQTKLAYYREIISIIAPPAKELLGAVLMFLGKQPQNQLQPPQNQPQPPQNQPQPPQNQPQPPQNQPQPPQNQLEIAKRGITIIIENDDPKIASEKIDREVPAFKIALINSTKPDRENFINMFARNGINITGEAVEAVRDYFVSQS